MKIGLPRLIRPFLLVMFLLSTFGLVAQNVAVKGKVTSGEDNSAIPGVNVIVKGSAVGTVTDMDGNYELNANAGDVIVFSFIGFLTEEMTVNASQGIFNVSMKPDLVDVEEVVVVGYGTQKKSDLTGAVVSVSSAEINRRPSTTIEQAMQGIAAGVNVTSNSGSPGDGAVIRIRGVGSVNNTNPLYVIDGVPVDGPNSTNPADIESISVLKDAAASAIYGARGANGVIMITTKKGKKGFHVNFESQFGVQKEWKRLDLLNSEEYALYINEAAENRNRPAPVITQDPYNQPYNTDWQEEMFQTAPMQKYNLSVSGATDNFNYNVSGGYLNQEGIMLSSAFNKYYLRANTEYKWKKLRVGESIAYNNSNKDNEKNSVGGRNQIERMLTITPNVPVYDTAMLGGYAGPTAVYGHDAVNPVGVANLYESNNSTHGILGSVFAEYEIIEGLTYKLTYGFDTYKSENTNYEPAYQMGDYQKVGEPNWDTTFNESNYSMIENLVSYDKNFGSNHLTAVAGYSQEKGSYETQKNTTKYYPVDDSTDFLAGQKFLYERGLVSYFGRINYAYDEKYLAQVNIRRDGSSKFGVDNRWGIFPSFSAGWVISKEEFMQSVPALSYLKLRGSWGKIGNQNINDYMYEASMNSYQNYVYNNEVVNGVGPAGYPNPTVQWETAIQSNVGADISFFDNKLNLTTEYYNNITEDMLINITMPLSNGSSNFPPQNAGSVSNKGWEFILNYKNWDNEFKYSITGNFATTNNEVTDLGPTDRPLYGGPSELGNSTKTEVGHPIGSFYGYVTDGIYKTQAEIDAMNTAVDEAGDPIIYAPFAKLGDIRFKDLNGDGVLNDDDRDYIGNAIPKYSYGLNVSGSYKGFDASFSFQGIKDVDIYRETKLWTDGMYTNFNASHAVDNRYRPSDISITTGEGADAVTVDYLANTNTNMPWAIKTDPNGNARKFSDRFIEDGSYLRLKDVTIGYSLSKSVVDRMKLGSVRFYFIGLNLLTITNYEGFDPEIGGSSTDKGGANNTARGIDNGYYPQAKAFMGGIQLSF